MSQFKFFHDDWLDCSDLFLERHRESTNLRVNLDLDFFDNLALDEGSLRSYRIKAAELTAELIGNKIALCISGGVDSQCMLQSFIEAKIDVDVYVLRFNNNLNVHDFNHAKLYCDKNNINLNVIEIDVLRFLSISNYEYAEKYKSISPHFNVHYKLFNILQEKNYDGVVAGGNTPLFTTHENTWGTNYSRSIVNYMRYSDISGFKCQGNFLSFYPKLTWAVSLLTPPVYDYINLKGDISIKKQRQYWEDLRYLQKTRGYKRAGYDIIPQEQKYTGFELVKKHLEEKTGDGWTFERLYRHPLEKIFDKFGSGSIRFVFKDTTIENKVLQLYTDNFLPGQHAPSGI